MNFIGSNDEFIWFFMFLCDFCIYLRFYVKIEVFNKNEVKLIFNVYIYNYNMIS